MIEKAGKQISEVVGDCLEYDPNKSGKLWRKYMRVRVMLDVRRPLMRTKKLKKKDGKTVEVMLDLFIQHH